MNFRGGCCNFGATKCILTFWKQLHRTADFGQRGIFLTEPGERFCQTRVRGRVIGVDPSVAMVREAGFV